ncbi:MAG: 2-oxoacid:ferredoxin oxidoreductase subunit alpha [Candidatus Methanomethylicaceae archaeon]|nr:2-oxoacid:ferredoxin oxidoreductase subunit alpha [Candidatus Verstraetearchaeota archaeon]
MDLNIIIGGPQGGGVETAGMLLIRATATAGLQVFGVREYHSNIKGKHSYFHIRTSNKPINSIKHPADILGGLDPETLATHFSELRKGGVVVYDEAIESKSLTRSPSIDPAKAKRLRSALTEKGIKDTVEGLREYLKGEGVSVYAIPFSKIISNVLKGTNIQIERTMNTAITSAILSILGMKKDIVYDAISSLFAGKAGIIEVNRKVADAVYEELSTAEKFQVESAKGEDDKKGHEEVGKRLLLAGNDAVAIGKILGGLRFQTYYPITPAADESLVIEEIAKIFDNEGRIIGSPIVVQTEDEISAVGMAIGGVLTGVRSATSTSGPGFSLMVEGLGWAGINEVPLVITYYQRGGPSTGLPTRHSQSDLLFSIFAGHGEFARIVIASGDHREAMEDAVKCFNYAEIFQVPVIHLLDKGLANSVTTVPVPSIDIPIVRGKIVDGGEEYKRFKLTEDRISPRAFLGRTIQWYTGDEHNEYGNICEDPVVREEMYRKRMEKRRMILEELPDWDKARFYGPEKYDDLLLTWGTTKGAVVDALPELNATGERVSVLQVRLMEPFPADYVSEFIAGSRRVVSIEANYTGQLAWLIERYCKINVDGKVLKYNGRTISEDEVLNGYRRIKEGETSVVLTGGE